MNGGLGSSRIKSASEPGEERVGGDSVEAGVGYAMGVGDGVCGGGGVCSGGRVCSGVGVRRRGVMCSGDGGCSRGGRGGFAVSATA